MTTVASSPSGRLTSLDVFRGATIAGMNLVNNPGDWSKIYAPFKHAAWNGWTFTDTIFPFFLWIVGVAMTFSFARRIERGDDRKKLFLHVFLRAAGIFGVGLFLSGFPFGLAFGHNFSFSTIRIPGVLQRIAICYLISSAIFLTTGIAGQIRWVVSLLGIYWLAVKLVPVPGFGPGILDPTGNLCWYIDSTVLAGHTWSGAPVPGFDPEGIFSTIPAIATTLFGVLTGHLLRAHTSQEEKTAWMFSAGSVLMLVGLIMDNWLPINKNLWTSSYSVFMAGLALICFAFCYWIIDVKGYKKWSKSFEIYGLNALTMFFLAGFFGRLTAVIKWTDAEGAVISLKTFYYRTFFMPLADPMNASFLHSLFYVVFLYLIAYLMYRKKWFLRF
jgi:predicted acyltransferase